MFSLWEKNFLLACPRMGSWRDRWRGHGDRRRDRNLLRCLRRVYRLRKDLLPAEAAGEMESLLRGRKILSQQGRDRVRELLRDHGGNLWPARPIAENGESFLLAAIVALAVRAFLIQPFSIPTNSMWPSHRGMASELRAEGGANWATALLRGGKLYDIKSPSAGEVAIPLNGADRARRQGSILPYESVVQRRFAIWPVHRRRHRLLVGGRPVTFTVPEDFDLESLLLRRFFPGMAPGVRLWQVPIAAENDPGGPVLPTGVSLRAGDSLLRFLLIHGDVLLVDRLTPHYRRPRRGEALVFATRDVPQLHPDDRYYIKRLVGLGDDVLAIGDGQLRVNGAPGNFSQPMARNNARIPPFAGYFPLGLLKIPTAVPDGTAFVLGDNSGNSYDSRFFGPIPLRAIIGRPLFRIFPFLR